MTVFSFFKINFFLLAIISISVLLPIAVALYYGEFEVIHAFALPGVFCVIVDFLQSGEHLDEPFADDHAVGIEPGVTFATS